MKRKFNMVALCLHVHSMQEGAAHPISLSNWWKISQTEVNNFAEMNRSATINTPSLATFLFSERNRTSGQFKLDEIKVTTEEQNSNGKKGYVANVRWMPPLQMQDIEDGEQNYCPTSGHIMRYKNHPYQIDRITTTQPIEITDELLRCIKEGKGEYVGQVMFNMLRAATSLFLKDVEAEFYDLDNNHIGKFADRHQGTVSTDPGKVANLFRDTANAYNEINEVEESNVEMDLAQSGIDEYVIFGGTVAKHYGKAKEISIGNTSRGIDASQLDTIENANILFDSYIESAMRQQNITNPMMFYRPGAAQVITYARNVGDFRYDDDVDHQRITIVDPILGIEWDMISNRVKCNEEISVNVFLELRWSVISYPDCVFADDPLRVGVNDVVMYSVQCGDTPVCDVPVDQQTSYTSSKPLNNDCDNDETCDPGCSVSFQQQFVSSTGDIIITAFPTPSLGGSVADPAGYAWELNGGGIGTPTPGYQLVLAAGGYADGDVVKVTVTDSEGCVADAEVVLHIPEIEVQVDGTPVADGATEDLGSVPQASSPTPTISIINTGSLNPLTIDNITVTGNVNAAFVAPSGFPKTAQFDFVLSFDDSGTGAKSVNIVVDSNDPNTPTYTITVDVTLT